MKARWTLIAFLLFTLVSIAAAFMLSQRKAVPAPAPTQRNFQVNGVVRTLESDGKTVVIEHEDIPDFMPAMIMPFTVKDRELLRQLRPGDHVRFELAVTRTDSWISRIERTGGASSAASISGSQSPALSTASELPEIEPGQRVPDFQLTDQNGHSFRLTDYRGKAVLITFIYTRCPLPNYCPLMSQNFSTLQKRLNQSFPGRFHLITISFDPEYDTPSVMKSYAGAFTKDESSWTFATGTKRQIEAVASRFGLIYLPEAGAFSHDLRTALIDPEEHLVHIWRSNVWTPDEVAQRVTEVLLSRSGVAPADAIPTTKSLSKTDIHALQ